MYGVLIGVGLALGLAVVPQFARQKAGNSVVVTPKEVVSQEDVADAEARARVLHDKIQGIVFGAVVGDALGRVTEFIETTDAIALKYGAKGISSFKDFTPGDWIMHPYSQNRDCIAAYTDDTLMSLIVLEEALRYTDAQALTDAIALRFRGLFGKNAFIIDPLYHVRAHGIQNRVACTRPEAKSNIEESPAYDKERDQAVSQEGGCGSVMRAWPLGIIFYTDLEKVALFADFQSRITHRNPMARAASAALAVGIASLLQGNDPDTTVDHMIKAAQKFDEAEMLYKPTAHKELDAASIKEDRLLTSDMIAYAAQQARAGIEPRDILGTHNTKLQNRSSEGFLLGWAADEAVAAAVYVFLRHFNDMGAALQESVNTPGDSDSIATLAAALVGAHGGWKTFKATGFDYSSLENKAGIEKLLEEVILHVD